MERSGDSERHEECLMAVKSFAALAGVGVLLLGGCSVKATATGSAAPGSVTLVRPLLDEPAPQRTTAVTQVALQDFWTSFQTGLTLAQTKPTPELADEIAWLRSHPRYLHHSLLRGTDYLPFLVQEAHRHGLPVDVVLIPALESSFNAATPGGGAGPEGG